MKREELTARELEQVIGATTKVGGGGGEVNIGDAPNVRVDVTPI